MPLNDDIFDILVRHQVWVQRYGGGLYNKLEPVLSQVFDDLVSRLAKTESVATQTKLKKLLSSFESNLIKASDKVLSDAYKELLVLAQLDSDFVVSRFNEVLKDDVEISFSPVSPSVLTSVVKSRPINGRIMKGWTKGLNRSAIEKMNRELTIGLVEGETISELTNRIKRVKSQTSVSLEMIARTATNHVSNQIKKEFYNKNNDLIGEVMWRSTLDSRTSPICRARDNKTYNLDSKYPVPPAHPNCRSVIVPVIKSWQSLGLSGLDKGTRASINGQVPSDLSYGEWLKKQPKSFIQEVLGKERANIFLDKGLAMDKFVDFKGKLLPLDQLKARVF